MVDAVDQWDVDSIWISVCCILSSWTTAWNRDGTQQILIESSESSLRCRGKESLGQRN